MKEITVKVFSASELYGNPDDPARITVIPSGFSDAQIMVVEDIDYTISASYYEPIEEV